MENKSGLSVCTKCTSIFPSSSCQEWSLLHYLGKHSVPLLKLLDQRATINADHYCRELQHPKEAIWLKHPPLFFSAVPTYSRCHSAACACITCMLCTDGHKIESFAIHIVLLLAIVNMLLLLSVVLVFSLRDVLVMNRIYYQLVGFNLIVTVSPYCNCRLKSTSHIRHAKLMASRPHAALFNVLCGSN
jgi:hypothetical protein